MVLEKERFSMYIKWIVDSIDEIQSYVKDMNLKSFEKDKKTINACLMLLIHIGETANKINKKYPSFDKIPHHLVIGLRNFIAHDYMGIRVIRIRKTITDNLPKLKKDLLEYKK